MNSTPPEALLNILRTFGRGLADVLSDQVDSAGLDQMSVGQQMPARHRSGPVAGRSVVFAVPGLPTNTMCRDRSLSGMPAPCRNWSARASATSRRTWSLTGSSPISCGQLGLRITDLHLGDACVQLLVLLLVGRLGPRPVHLDRLATGIGWLAERSELGERLHHRVHTPPGGEQLLHVGDKTDGVGGRGGSWGTRQARNDAGNLRGHRQPGPAGVDLARQQPTGQPAPVVLKPVGGVEAGTTFLEGR